MIVRALLVLFGVTALSGAALAAEPVILPPTGPWDVRRDGDRCVMERAFGADDKQVTLWFDQFEPGGSFLVSMHGKPVVLPTEIPNPGANGGNLPYGLRFRATEPPREYASALGGKDANGVPYLVLGSATLGPNPGLKSEAEDEDQDQGKTRQQQRRITGEDLRSAQLLLLHQPLHRPLRLETGPMMLPTRIMGECAEALVRSWDPLRRRSSLKWRD